jgi:hypothetical protein
MRANKPINPTFSSLRVPAAPERNRYQPREGKSAIQIVAYDRQVMAESRRSRPPVRDSSTPDKGRSAQLDGIKVSRTPVFIEMKMYPAFVVVLKAEMTDKKIPVFIARYWTRSRRSQG